MESFVTLKHCLRLIGILKWKSSSSTPFIGFIRRTVFFGVAMSFVLSLFWFFAFTAQTFSDYSVSFYCMLTGILVWVWYSIYIWEHQEYSDFFNALDGIIEQSMFKIKSSVDVLTKNPFSWDILGSQNRAMETIHKLANERAEKLSKILYLIVMKIQVPIIVVIPPVLSIIKYIFWDYGLDSFQQIFPAT